MNERRSFWAAAALYAVLTLVLTFPLSMTLHRTLPADDPDGHLFMWTLAWNTHALVHQPLSIFDANIFYPSRNSLALSENLLGSAIVAAPVLWMSGNPVLAVNVVSLLSCMLCGLGAYVLARRLGLSTAAALLTGLIFAFAPPRFFRFSQLHLTAVQWIPFTLAFLHAYLDEGKRRHLWMAIGFFTLQVLASGHGAVFAVVAILLLLGHRAVFGEPLRPARRVRDAGLIGGLLLTPSVVVLIPYRMNQVEVGLRRVLDSTGTPIESFFASPTRADIFLRSLVTDRDINSAASAWLFPGLLPLALALVAVVAAGGGLLKVLALTRRTPRPRNEPALDRAPFLTVAGAVLVSALLGTMPALLRTGDGLTPQLTKAGVTAWTGYLTVPQAGRYDFGTRADDRSRLTIDETVVIDRSPDRPDSPSTGSLRLERGSHRIVVEQTTAEERTTPSVLWTHERAPQSYQSIPSWALSRRSTSASKTQVLRTAGSMRFAALIAAGLGAAWWIRRRFVRHRESWMVAADFLRRSPVVFYLLLTIVCVSLSTGAAGLWRYVYWLPGFNFIRGPSRFMILGLLGVAVLAGVGFDWIGSRLTLRHRRLAAIVAGGLLLAEFAAIPYRGVPYELTIPAADVWLAQRPTPFAVAEVPVTPSARYHSNYMLHSMAHWQKTVHGFSGIVPPLHEELYDQLRSFPSEESLRSLARLDVTYVVVHGSWFPQEERAAVEMRLVSFGSWLKLEYEDSDSRVYSVRRPDATPGRANN